MIKPKVTISGAQTAKDAINKALGKFMSDKFVTIGIHEDAGQHESDDITNAALGAIHEYGADIDHPGGTSYGFASKSAANRNEVRFLKTGKGYAELGTTGPHKINIPARPWLNPGVMSGNVEYLNIIERALKDGKTLDYALNQVGVVAVGMVQKYMTDLRSPANAPSTIKKKGSSNPLIDSGALRQSVTYKITTSEPTEGL
jgi:phage gpG-like protein